MNLKHSMLPKFQHGAQYKTGLLIWWPYMYAEFNGEKDQPVQISVPFVKLASWLMVNLLA